MTPAYEAQVDLLLRVLPHVAAEPALALKGGTAINLFVRDMPRLSVDLDLTYLPFDGREAALAGVAAALGRVAAATSAAIPGSQTSVRAAAGKLLCRTADAQVKVEVNLVMRGHLFPPRTLALCDAAQSRFARFAAAPVVSDAELFGGKLVAALDRQHPRDLFDARYVLDTHDLAGELKAGFLAALLSHNRPPHEVLRPNPQDRRPLFDAEFRGMARLPFDYAQRESTLAELAAGLDAALDDGDRQFLLGFAAGEPEWMLAPTRDVQRLPAVLW